MTERTASDTDVPEAADHGERDLLFAEQPPLPRRRRPSDTGRLIVAGAAFVLLGWIARGEPESDARIAEALDGMPSWLRTLSSTAYAAAALAALVLVIAAIASKAVRRKVVRDLICALGVAILLAMFAGRAATGAWPHLLPEFTDAPERLPYPTARPALVLVVTLVLAAYATSGVQRVMRWMAFAVLVAPLVLGVSTVTAMFGALALGLFSVAAVRLLFGSPEGLPSLDRLAATLDECGVSVRDVAYLDEQPGTVGLATATTTDGSGLDIKIYGRDAANRQRAERVWRTLWYRRAGPSPRAGRSEQAEHEALAVLSAREAGVQVPALVTGGQLPNGEVLLVSEAPAGNPLAQLSAPTDTQLAASWRELRALHTDARLSHGSISPRTIQLDGDGARLLDLSGASLMPTEQQRATDLASMLATQAIASGSERAVAAALDSVESDVLESALPYVQSAVLDPGLRRELKSAGLDMNDLGEALAGALQVESPEPASIRRVSWSDLLIAVLAIFAANALISQIAEVGFVTLLEEFGDASTGWLVVAFVVNILGFGTHYFALKAVVERPLPFLPVSLLQLAKEFIGLVVPSMVGRVGLDIRFLQKMGVSVVAASTQGPVIGFAGFVAEVTLMVLSAWSIGQELESDELADFDGGGLVLLAVIVVVVGLAIVFGVPQLREKVLPVIQEAFASVRSILTSPAKLVTIFSTEFVDRLIKALALAATLAAFGASLPFPAVVFVSVGTGLLAGLAPVPGGIGVAEATMSGLLTATGLPPELSVSVAIVHRVITAYLPPVVGFFAQKWLKDEGYL